MKKHPSAQERFKALAARFMALRNEHRRASDALWIGTLATSFTDDELAILGDYLSKHDVNLLRRVRQPISQRPVFTQLRAVDRDNLDSSLKKLK